MDFSKLLDVTRADDFDVYAAPLTPEVMEQYGRLQAYLHPYWERVTRQVELMHATRHQARKDAGLTPSRQYEGNRYPGASCTFERFDEDGTIRYSGESWFRGECDRFEASECEPLPGALLNASEADTKAYFAKAAADERQVLDQALAAAQKEADAKRQEADRAEYERLRLKFG